MAVLKFSYFHTVRTLRKLREFSLNEMAIFGDASLIISIAASEVDLEAGD